MSHVCLTCVYSAQLDPRCDFHPDQNYYASREADCRANKQHRPFFPFVSLPADLLLSPLHFFWCFPSLPSNQRKKLRKRDLCFNFFFGLMTHEKVRRDKSGSYVHFFYMFINVCYELMIGWNYGSGNDRNGEKMAPCFPRGHFAR